MVLPVFLEGDAAPAFYVANRAHHADVGGKFAGSMGPATTIEDEGIRISPVRIVRGGAVDREVLDWILRSVRTPEEREGDLAAQMGACRVGRAARARTGGEVRHGKAARPGARSCSIIRSGWCALSSRKCPQASFDAEDWLDDDGVTDDPIRIAVRLRIDPAVGEIDVDFAGSSAQVAGAVNAVRAITLSACFYVLRCLLPEDAPATEGILRRAHAACAGGIDRECAAARRSGRRERGDFAADCGCADAGAGKGCARAGSGGERGNHEQCDDRRC